MTFFKRGAYRWVFRTEGILQVLWSKCSLAALSGHGAVCIPSPGRCALCHVCGLSKWCVIIKVGDGGKD